MVVTPMQVGMLQTNNMVAVRDLRPHAHMFIIPQALVKNIEEMIIFFIGHVLKIFVNSSGTKFCYLVPEVVSAVVLALYPSGKRGSYVGGEHAGPAWHSMVPECIWLP